MYRISIEMPETIFPRVSFLLKYSERFAEAGIAIGANLSNPDLRLLHDQLALAEWRKQPGQIDTPLFIWEQRDGAGVMKNPQLRNMIKHPDVRLWFKLNTFRDWRMHNESFVYGNWHYKELCKYETLNLGPAKPDEQLVKLDEDSCRKIAMFPLVPSEFFDDLTVRRRLHSDRRIDVNFIGLVDEYPNPDDIYVRAHRRAAVLAVANLRHRRTLVGVNRVVPRDEYRTSLLRSRISLAPWGYGEYSRREYESILNGCVVIKPNTDHVRTFDPDLYQSKYYVACRPDFSDLEELVDKVLANYVDYFDMARKARDDLVEANSEERIFAYFLNLFEKQRMGQPLVQPVA